MTTLANCSTTEGVAQADYFDLEGFRATREIEFFNLVRAKFSVYIEWVAHCLMSLLAQGREVFVIIDISRSDFDGLGSAAMQNGIRHLRYAMGDAHLDNLEMVGLEGIGFIPPTGCWKPYTSATPRHRWEKGGLRMWTASLSGKRGFRKRTTAGGEV